MIKADDPRYPIDNFPARSRSAVGFGNRWQHLVDQAGGDAEPGGRMAWVTQIFHNGHTKVLLEEWGIDLFHGDNHIRFNPWNSEEAHAIAMMLRRAARRLEGVGLDLMDESKYPSDRKRVI